MASTWEEQLDEALGCNTPAAMFVDIDTTVDEPFLMIYQYDATSCNDGDEGRGRLR